MSTQRWIGAALALVLAGGVTVLPADASSAATVPVQCKTMVTPPTPLAVGFANQTTGWLIEQRAILRTTDGGRHFAVQYRAAFDLRSMQVVTPQVVVAWGGDQYVLTTDAGAHWRTGSVVTGHHASREQIDSMHFVTPQLGYALYNPYNYGSGAVKLYRTTDGGVNWTAVQVPNTTISVGFANVHDGWLITASNNKSDGGFYRTIDGGARWVKTQSEKKNWYVMGATVFPVSAQAAYAQVVAQGGMSQSSYSIFRTANGKEWTPILGISTAGSGPAPGVDQRKVAIGPGYDAGPVAVIGKDVVKVIGGMEATGIGVLSLATTNDGGARWHTYAPIPGANGMAFAGADLSFVDAKNGWLLDSFGQSAELLHTTDGGATWQAMDPRVKNWPVLGVAFVSREVAYGLGVVGNVDEVQKSTNGGRTWRPYSRLPVRRDVAYIGPNYGQAIAMTNHLGVAVGGDGHLYGTRDGGKSWRALKTPTAGERVMSVYLQPDTQQLAIKTQQHGVYISRNFGAHWSPVSAGSQQGGAWMQAINALAGSGLAGGIRAYGTDSWGAAFAGAKNRVAWLQSPNDGGFLKSTDAGAHWTSYQFPKESYLMYGNLAFLNAGFGWIWTLDGQLYTTTNGGRNWQQV